MVDLIVTEDFLDVASFCDALHPLNRRWGGQLGTWVFRGHWDSEWELLPSLYREKQVQPFLGERWGDIVADGAQHVHDAERRILFEAYRGFDESGLSIPYALEVKQMLTENFDWVEGIVVPFMALAQHHGVPTRLLDWTTRTMVAAYFAASELTKLKPENSIEGRLEIIALSAMAFEIVPPQKDDFCRIVRAPRASNPNLHAQAGVFSMCKGPYQPVPLDKLITQEFTQFGDQVMKPMMRRLTLPQRLARELLAVLAFEGVTAATIFPGYGGAVLRLKEDKVCSYRIEHIRRT
ncbi:MAG: FRG domain-containing protein [Pseudomonadota bacterium]